MANIKDPGARYMYEYMLDEMRAADPDAMAKYDDAIKEAISSGKSTADVEIGLQNVLAMGAGAKAYDELTAAAANISGDTAADYVDAIRTMKKINTGDYYDGEGGNMVNGWNTFASVFTQSNADKSQYHLESSSQGASIYELIENESDSTTRAALEEQRDALEQQAKKTEELLATNRDSYVKANMIATSHAASTAYYKALETNQMDKWNNDIGVESTEFAKAAKTKALTDIMYYDMYGDELDLSEVERTDREAHINKLKELYPEYVDYVVAIDEDNPGRNVGGAELPEVQMLTRTEAIKKGWTIVDPYEAIRDDVSVEASVEAEAALMSEGTVEASYASAVAGTATAAGLTIEDKRRLIGEYEAAKHTGETVDITEDEVNQYKADIIADFESSEVRINGAADAKAYNERKALVAQYKSDLGYEEATVADSNYDASPVEVDDVITEGEIIDEAESPDPYAFEKPDRPADMSDADYDALCAAAEQEHIDKVNNEMADAVIRGEYGNGSERVAALEAAGYDYSQVQGIVNDKMSGYSQPTASAAVDTSVTTSTVSKTPDASETEPTAIAYEYSHQELMDDGTTCKYYSSKNGDSLMRTHYENGELAKEHIHYANGDEKRTLYINGEKAYVEISDGSGAGHTKVIDTYAGNELTNHFTYDADLCSMTDGEGRLVTDTEIHSATAPVLNEFEAQWNANVKQIEAEVGTSVYDSSVPRELDDSDFGENASISRTSAEQIAADEKAEIERRAAEESLARVSEADKPVVKSEPQAESTHTSEPVVKTEAQTETQINRDRFNKPLIASSGFDASVDDKGFGKNLWNTPVTCDPDPDPDV